MSDMHDLVRTIVDLLARVQRGEGAEVLAALGEMLEIWLTRDDLPISGPLRETLDSFGHTIGDLARASRPGPIDQPPPAVRDVPRPRSTGPIAAPVVDGFGPADEEAPQADGDDGIELVLKRRPEGAPDVDEAASTKDGDEQSTPSAVSEKAAAEKAAPKKAAAKKAAPKKAAAKKAAPKKAAAKKATSKKNSAKKAAAKKAPTEKAAEKKASGKKASARRASKKSENASEQTSAASPTKTAAKPKKAASARRASARRVGARASAPKKNAGAKAKKEN